MKRNSESTGGTVKIRLAVAVRKWIMGIKSIRACLYCYVLLTVYVFATAVYIEYLNYQAGGILPRKEYYNNDPKQGSVKWRYRITADLKGLAAAANIYASDYEQIKPVTDPNNGTAASVTNIRQHDNFSETKSTSDIQAEKDNHLHKVVVQLGLPQYPLLLVAFVLFFICLCNSMKSEYKMSLPLIGICFVFNLESLIALFTRDYFGSLGW